MCVLSWDFQSVIYPWDWNREGLPQLVQWENNIFVFHCKTFCCGVRLMSTTQMCSCVMWLQARPMLVRRRLLCSCVRSFLSGWPTSWRRSTSSLTSFSAPPHYSCYRAGKYSCSLYNSISQWICAPPYYSSYITYYEPLPYISLNIVQSPSRLQTHTSPTQAAGVWVWIVHPLYLTESNPIPGWRNYFISLCSCVCVE